MEADTLKFPALRVLPVNIALVLIGLADLATTVFWLQTGRAIEANPLMAAVLDNGLGWFVVLKLSTLAAYVVVMEWYRRRRSASLACAIGGVTTFAYLGIYAISFVLMNSGCTPR